MAKAQPTQEERTGITMPVLVTLIEENARTGTFYWNRTAFKNRVGPRTDALVPLPVKVVAPGIITDLRAFHDWGLAHLGKRAETRSVRVRAGKIEKRFEKTEIWKLDQGGITRAVVHALVAIDPSSNNLLVPTWLETISVLGLGVTPGVRAFNAGPTWELPARK